MKLSEMRLAFERTKRIYDTALLTQNEVDLFCTSPRRPSESTIPASPPPCLANLLSEGESASFEQQFVLSSGNLGCIGTLCYVECATSGELLTVGLAAAFVLTPQKDRLLAWRIIATRPCYPPAPAASPEKIDLLQSPRILRRSDGKYDLYALCGGRRIGRITIDSPFEGFGEITAEK